MNEDGSSQGGGNMPVGTIGDFYPRSKWADKMFGIQPQPTGVSATGGVDDVGKSNNAPAFSILSIVAILVAIRILWEIAS